ncbi:glycosyltransferase [Photobacterium leiognathi]|uniref:glycosyltransferase n=1 Tax=Photobacterium leiognathi TaxID=553611 RepID=UPI00298128D5|nr:glycosyltransferase [Photobacterium leiognathi]
MSTICYVITGLRRGGAEKQLLMMTQEAISSGYKVDIYVLSQSIDMYDDFIASGASVFILNISKYNFIFKVFNFIRIIKNKKYKFVHAHMFHSILFSRAIKFLNPDIKIISSAHCNEEGIGIRGLLLKITNKFSDINTHVSNVSLNLFIKNRVFSKNNSVIVSNAILTENVVTQKNMISSVGRLEVSKGFFELIQAFKGVADENKEIKLLIVGDGPCYDELNDFISELELKNRVFLLGNRFDAINIIAGSRLFISMSKSESFGMAICEAIGSNVISLIPDLDAVNEVIGNEYPNYLKHSNDIEEVSCKVISLLHDDTNISIKTSSEYIKERYNSRSIFNEWKRLYTNN